MASPRLSARALVVHDGRLLLVNATPDREDGKWCAPGGGVYAGASLKDNLAREVLEETGLYVTVGDLCAVSEFFDPERDFHQVDVFFRASTQDSKLPDDWRDVGDVVVHRGFFTLSETKDMDVYPRFLQDGFWLNNHVVAPLYKGTEVKE